MPASGSRLSLILNGSPKMSDRKNLSNNTQGILCNLKKYIKDFQTELLYTYLTVKKLKRGVFKPLFEFIMHLLFLYPSLQYCSQTASPDKTARVRESQSMN